MSKKVDTAGMWTIKGNPITHDGVAMYSGNAIDPDGEFGLDPNRLYPVYRPFDELLKACESFNGKPLTNNHEMIGTSEGLTKPDDKNIGGTIYNVRADDSRKGVIIADMTIYGEELQNCIKSGKVELSLGYWCKYRREVGTFDGTRYEFVQYDLEGNHIALVDCGRMGSGVRVFDGKTLTFDSMEITEMKKQTKTLDADELRKEIADLLKSASDDALAKCKDILAPAEPNKEGEDDDPDKGKDADEPKKNGEDEPEDDPAKKGEGDEDGDDEPKKEGDEDEGDEPKKDEPKKDAQDAAPSMKDVLREMSRREKLYSAVIPHTGAFDHDEMTAREVAKYAAEKLGVAVCDGAEVEIVEAHLAGLGANAKKQDKIVAGDTAEAGASGKPSAKLKEYLGL
jgi:uncharacterized protein